MRWAIACKARNTILPYLGCGGVGGIQNAGSWGSDALLVDAAVECWRECVVGPQMVAYPSGSALGEIEAAFSRQMEGNVWVEVEVPSGQFVTGPSTPQPNVRPCQTTAPGSSQCWPLPDFKQGPLLDSKHPNP